MAPDCQPESPRITTNSNNNSTLTLSLSLCLTFLSCVALNSYMYLPFRPEDLTGRDDGEAVLLAGSGTVGFRAAFYVGLGVGSVAGGLAAYL